MFFYGWTAVVPPSVLFSTAKTNKDMNTNPTSNMNTNIWTALEIGTGAIPSVWRERAGDQFDTIRSAFLQPRPEPAKSFPCRKCGCAHNVTIYAPDDIIAVCACESWNCNDMILTAADIVVLELNWAKLGRALCKAFGLDARTADLGLTDTVQIGSWSCDAVPVILTIQRERYDFQHVVAMLAARLRKKFILLAPTSQNLDATSQELLANFGAEFFALDTHLTLTDHGAFHSRTTPGELFAKFTPQPKEPQDDDTARRAFAAIKALDCRQGARKVGLYTVFRLYCVDCLSASQIARKCGSARSIIYGRLAELRQKLGRDPAQLRQYSAHFERIEESLSDPRAKRIHRKTAAHGDEYSDEQEI